MQIVGLYSFNGGQEAVERNYDPLWQEAQAAINAVDAAQCRTKISKEKTMPGKRLYNPRALNQEFKRTFGEQGWQTNIRIQCDYSSEFYVDGYEPSVESQGAFREMDFVKAGLGVEVQFGKYAFMVYNVCAKMTIFSKQGFIKVGIEIVPVKEFAAAMSTGVSYFEQFVWDLEQRGVSNIDIPVLVVGIK